MTESTHPLERELYARVADDNALFLFLQQGSLDGLWFWDLTNPEDEWMSPRFWEVFGYEPEEKPHKAAAWQDMIHPDDLKLAVSNFEKHCADPGHAYDQEVRYRHKKGHWVWVRCRGVVLRDEDGTPVRMLGAHQDITRLKNEIVEREAAQKELAVTLERLQGANAALAQKNRELESLARIMAHDLRAPLRTIGSFSDLLEEECGDELSGTAREFLMHLTAASSQMGSLVRDLVQYASIGADPLVQSEAIDLNQVLLDVRGALKGPLIEREAQLDIGVLPTVLGVRVELFRVFQNLIDNACSHAAERQLEISISAETEAGVAHLVVRDNGTGFDPAYATRIFELFRRLGSARKGHTGFGLAACKKIVEQAGGRIWAESSPGKGAAFHIELPLAISQPAPSDDDVAADGSSPPASSSAPAS